MRLSEIAGHVMHSEPCAYRLEQISIRQLCRVTPDNRRRAYTIIKRGVDITLSAMSLLVLSPLMAVLALCIRLNDGGPAIHKRACVGRDGCPFLMYKFRSMVVNADDVEHLLTPAQREQFIKEVKLDSDPRITRIGRIIRKLSADELPQFVNVLKGEMSLVGPRPMAETETLRFGGRVNEVLQVRPGITGYWQVHGRNTKKYETGERQAMELYYVRNRSCRLDLLLLIQTVACVFRCEGK